MTEHSEPLRVALIGYGFAGRTFHAPLIGAVPRLALLRVASRDAARVAVDLPRVAVDDDPMRVVHAPDIDVVVLATPNDTHFPLALAALRAGKHVVVDKPLTPSLAQARTLAETARAHGRLLSVFHNRRFDSDFLAVSEAVRAGLIGDVLHLESRIERFRPAVRDRWRERAGPASGLWWDLGPHLVDQALLLLGRPDTVQADLALQRDGATTDDWAHVVLGFGRARAVLHMGMVAAGPAPRFLVHGSRGTLLKVQGDPQERQLLAGQRPGESGWGVDPDPLVLRRDGEPDRLLETPRGDQSRYYAALADAIAGGGPGPVPVEQALHVMEVLEAGGCSAAAGRRQVLASPDP